jgi:hypothetical protein
VIVRATWIGTVVATVVALPVLAMAGTGSVQLDASIEGRNLREVSDVRPLRLDPAGRHRMQVVVTNAGAAPVSVRTVRLEGRLAGLVFYAYDTAVGMQVAPGTTEERTFDLDLVGLNGQATGLIPSRVLVLDPERRVVAATEFTADVRGSARSVYGGFGIALAVLTVVFLVRALVDLARHLLPFNRWRRGVRFSVPGFGIGLTIVFTLSAFRVFVPTNARWLTFVVAGGAVFFVLGYLTPTPPEPEERGRPLAEDARATVGPHQPQSGSEHRES